MGETGQQRGEAAGLGPGQARNRIGTTRDTRGESVSEACGGRAACRLRGSAKDEMGCQTNGVCTRKQAWWQEMAVGEECKVPR